VRTGTWDYTIDAAATPEAAHALLSDLTRQGELHPLIVKVVERPPAPGALATYAITDVLRLGPVPFRITYVADQVSVSDGLIETVAHQKPGTTIRNRTTIAATPTGVRIEVHVELTAPSLLFSYAYKQGRAAHLELAQRIQRVLESQG
jgi:hypothetical protein